MWHHNRKLVQVRIVNGDTLRREDKKRPYNRGRERERKTVFGADNLYFILVTISDWTERDENIFKVSDDKFFNAIFRGLVRFRKRRQSARFFQLTEMEQACFQYIHFNSHMLFIHSLILFLSLSASCSLRSFPPVTFLRASFSIKHDTIREYI